MLRRPYSALAGQVLLRQARQVSLQQEPPRSLPPARLQVVWRLPQQELQRLSVLDQLSCLAPGQRRSGTGCSQAQVR